MTDEQSLKQYEKMTATPVHRLVMTLAVPTVISMLITSLYNMADTYFVSTLGTSASGATGVVFGLMSIIQAFGFMFGHGCGSCISRHLGKRDVESARTYSSTGFYLALITGSVILLIGLLLQTSLMRVLGSTNSILPYAKSYSTFILIAAPAMATSCVMNNILRYEGKATYAMIGLTSGGILNIFGDYILIQHLGLGIAGAGISTAISQYVSMTLLMLPFLTGRVESSLNPRYITRKLKIIVDIVTVGLPSLTRQGLNSISVMVLNLCAAPFGDAAIAGISITTRIVNFMFCISVGLGQGFQPVSAFNYGAKKYDRVKEACRFTCLCSMMIMMIPAALGILFAEPLIRLFRDDKEVIAIGVTALRFQSVALIIVPISLSGNMLFQSVGEGALGTLLASIRSGLVFIPVLLILNHFLGILGIQMAQPVSDVISAMITLPIMIKFFRKLPGAS